MEIKETSVALKQYTISVDEDELKLLAAAIGVAKTDEITNLISRHNGLKLRTKVNDESWKLYVEFTNKLGW